MQQEFAFVNFFRGLAAFWVLIAHCMIWGGARGGVLDPKLAVDLFMLISGFLMAANASFNRARQPFTSTQNVYRFWLRRFFRIAPAYYVSLAAAVIFSTYFLSGYSELQQLNPGRWRDGGVYDPSRIDYSFTNILLHISFLFGLHPNYSFSTFLPDWSLSLEMQFYFAFPFLFLLMDKFGFTRTALFVSVSSFVLGFYVFMYLAFPEPSFLLMKLNYFIAGILVFRFIELRELNRESVCYYKLKTVAIVLSVLVLASLDYLRYGNDIFILWALSLFLLIFAELERLGKTPSIILRLFNSRPIRFASNSSYGVYLFHGFFISMFGLFIGQFHWLVELELTTRLISMAIFVSASSYAFSHLIYKFVELPGIQYGKSVAELFFRGK